MVDNICELCGKELLKKPIKTISFYGAGDRYKLVRKENAFTNTQYFCSLECRDNCHGDWVDCINPPKNALTVKDDYPDEPNGQFYCPQCNKHTSQKTYKTACIKCQTPLMRTGVHK